MTVEIGVDNDEEDKEMMLTMMGQMGKEMSFLMELYRTGGTRWSVFVGPTVLVVFNNFYISPARAIESLHANQF
jgi:hypothetical protein